MEQNEFTPPKQNNADAKYTSLKVVLGLLPGGGIISELFAKVITSPIEKRREKWMCMVANALTQLMEQDATVIKDLEKNEEFASLLISASINANKTHLTFKHERLRNSLVNSFRSAIDFDVKQIFINFIDELGISHIRILQLLKDCEADIKNINEYESLYEKIINLGLTHNVVLPRIEISIFRFFIKDLEAKGLLFISNDMQEVKGQVCESSSLSVGDEDENLSFLKVTDFGANFLKFIANPNESINNG